MAQGLQQQLLARFAQLRGEFAADEISAALAVTRYYAGNRLRPSPGSTRTAPRTGTSTAASSGG